MTIRAPNAPAPRLPRLEYPVAPAPKRLLNPLGLSLGWKLGSAERYRQVTHRTVPAGPRTWLRVLWALFPAGALLAHSLSSSAQIYIHAQPQPASISSISSSTAGADQVDLLVIFSSNVARFAVVGNNTRQLAVIFVRTSLPPNLNPPAPVGGLLSSFRLSRQDDLVTLNITARDPVALDVTPIGDAALNLRLMPSRRSTAEAQPVRR